MIKNRNLINIIFLTIIFMCTGEVIKISFLPIYAYLLILALIMYLIILFANKDTIKLKINKLLLLSLVWMTFGFFQMMIAGVDNTYRFYISLLFDLTIIILILLTANEKKTILFYCKAVVIGHILSILVSIYEFQTNNHIVKLSQEYIRIYGANAFGFQVNINDNVTALFMGIIATLILFAENRKIKLKTIFILTLTIYIIFRIGSRSGYISLISFGITMIYVNLIDKFTYNKKSKILINSIFLLLIGVTLIWIFNNNTLLEVLGALFSEKEYYSDLYRINIIKETFKLAYNNMFLGMGPGGSTLTIGINPHFLFIEILVDYGIIILYLILNSLLDIFKINTFNMDRFTKSIIIAFVIGFIAISIASSSLIRVRIAWIMLSIVFSLYKFYEKEEKRLFDVKIQN